MKQEFKVEIRGQKQVYYFETKEEATAYAITATAWTGGQYRITPVIVATEEAK
jgi:predicted butyrate kinase (DUF1464 family)